MLLINAFELESAHALLTHCHVSALCTVCAPNITYRSFDIDRMRPGRLVCLAVDRVVNISYLYFIHLN